jgi:hypothetical protein
VKVNPQHRSGPGAEAVISEAGSLWQTLREHGVTLMPMHPGVDDSTLASYFTADVDDDQVETVLDALRSSAAIEAAYVKPADELP